MPKENSPGANADIFYRLALVLVRLAAGIAVVGGVFLLIASFVAANINMEFSALPGMPMVLRGYGLVYLSVGVGLMLFGKWIAKFSAKT